MTAGWTSEGGLLDTLAVLERTPDVLRSLVVGLPHAWLEGTEGRDTFSTLEVLAHLAQAEESLWIPRLRSILEHGEEATFKDFDRFAHRAWFRGRSADELLGRFSDAREASLEKLREIPSLGERLQERGRHPEFGSVTAAQLLATWVVHDLSHTRQICRVLATQLKMSVGPWEAYLSVFRDRAPQT